MKCTVFWRFRSKTNLVRIASPSHVVIACYLQELRQHGVRLGGPCKNLLKAGNQGKWKSNIQRDVLRQASTGDDASRMVLLYSLMFCWS